MANRSYCRLTDAYYTESTIQSKLSEAYKVFYLFDPLGSCEGCGSRGVCTAHIIARARCKVLNLTSLIWTPENWFRSCHPCNLLAELPSSPRIKTLLNFDDILKVTKKYDPETYSKLCS